MNRLNECQKIVDKADRKFYKNITLYKRTALLYISYLNDLSFIGHIYNNEIILKLLKENIKDYFVSFDPFDGLGLLMYVLISNKKSFDDELYNKFINIINSKIILNLASPIKQKKEIDIIYGILPTIRLELALDDHFIYSEVFNDRISEIIKITTRIIRDDDNLNFGFSHGLSGVMQFLIDVNQYDVLKKYNLNSVIELIYGCFCKYVYSNNNTYLFPVVKRNGELIFENKYPLSWCYGLSGITVAMYHASKLLNKNIDASEIVNNYINSINMLGYDSFISAMFCHGLGGILTCTNILYRETLNNKLLMIIESCISKYADMLIVNEMNTEMFTNKDNNLNGEVEESRIYDSIINGQMACILPLLNYIDDKNSSIEYITCLR
jgi:hypothetical protein